MAFTVPVLMAFCLSELVVSHGEPVKIGGVNFVAEGFEGPLPYDDPASLASIAYAKQIGVTDVAFSFPWYTLSINSTGPIYRVDGPCPSGAPFNNATSPTDASVITAIRAVHALGMRVILRPMVDPQWGVNGNTNKVSRSDIGRGFSSADWVLWFAVYHDFILHWAQIAAEEDVETFCIGAELGGTVGQESMWRAMFSAVRAVFSGAVYYSGTGENLPWWDASDYIAQDSYPALTNATADPADQTVDDLVTAWGPVLTGLKAQSDQHGGKPVLLAETGICSIEKLGLFHSPSFFDCYTYPVNQAVQAAYYESVFRAPYVQPWIAGVLFWKWAAQGGANDTTFFPYEKAAAVVMQSYLTISD